MMDRLLGLQVVYVPLHVREQLGISMQTVNATDIRNILATPGVEAGFITERNAFWIGAVFARYWYPNKLGKELRTQANSELTALTDLVVYNTVSNDDVLRALVNLGYDRDRVDILLHY